MIWPEVLEVNFTNMSGGLREVGGQGSYCCSCRVGQQ